MADLESLENRFTPGTVRSAIPQRTVSIPQRTGTRDQRTAARDQRTAITDQRTATRQNPKKSKDYKKIKKLKKLESPDTPDSEIRRYLRDERFKLEEKRTLEGASKPGYIKSEMMDFLSNVYLGDLYGNTLYDEDKVGGPIQDYLYFLNPEDPLYGITSITILMRLIYIYIIVNRIKFYIKSPTRTLGRDAPLELKLISGTEEPTELIEYFPEAYDDIAERYSEAGSKTFSDTIIRLSLLDRSRRIQMSSKEMKDFARKSVRLMDALKFSYKMLKEPLIKPSRE